MRISCNGCRVLRKGCSDDCSIRPCLEWIKSPDFQANATVFLAKFYGRAGLVNLINAGPQHLRPAIFTSLLYEACGRIVNPIYGSAGLLSSGNWHLCQQAVEAVLKGAPITPMEMDAAEETKTKAGQPMKAAYDIRHINKKGSLNGSVNDDLHQVRKRCRFKRSGPKKAKRSRVSAASTDESGRDEAGGSPSHDSSLSHQSDSAVEPKIARASGGNDRLAGAEPVQETKPCLESAGEVEARADGEVIDLDLTLGVKPVIRHRKEPTTTKGSPRAEPEPEPEDGSGISCKIELGLDYLAS